MTCATEITYTPIYAHHLLPTCRQLTVHHLLPTLVPPTAHETAHNPGHCLPCTAHYLYHLLLSNTHQLMRRKRFATIDCVRCQRTTKCLPSANYHSLTTKCLPTLLMVCYLPFTTHHLLRTSTCKLRATSVRCRYLPPMRRLYSQPCTVRCLLVRLPGSCDLLYLPTATHTLPSTNCDVPAHYATYQPSHCYPSPTTTTSLPCHSQLVSNYHTLPHHCLIP